MVNFTMHVACDCEQCRRRENLLQNRLDMYTNELYYDFTLRVESSRPMIIKGHQMIFASASKPFADLLSRAFSEEEKGKDDPICIEDDISPVAFHFVIKWIYGSAGDFWDMSIVCEAYKFAHKWLIEDLMYVSAEKLKTAKCDRILQVYETFKTVGKEEDLDVALQFIAKNATGTLGTTRGPFCWTNAAPSTVLDIFRLPHLKVASEEVLLKALVRWGRENSENSDLRTVIAEPLRLIRFLSMEPKDFAELTDEYADVFSVEEEFQILVSLTLADRRHMPPNFTLIGESRLSKDYYQFDFSNFGVDVRFSDARVNSETPPYTLKFCSVLKKEHSAVCVSSVSLDCLSLENNYGLEADIICTLTESESGERLGVVKFKGKISSHSDKVLKFIRPVPIKQLVWYQLSVEYFHQDLLYSKEYQYKGYRLIGWGDAASLEVDNPSNSHLDMSSLDFFCEDRQISNR